jgi:hypothetical protein
MRSSESIVVSLMAAVPAVEHMRRVYCQSLSSTAEQCCDLLVSIPGDEGAWLAFVYGC